MKNLIKSFEKFQDWLYGPANSSSASIFHMHLKITETWSCWVQWVKLNLLFIFSITLRIFLCRSHQLLSVILKSHYMNLDLCISPCWVSRPHYSFYVFIYGCTGSSLFACANILQFSVRGGYSLWRCTGFSL